MRMKKIILLAVCAVAAILVLLLGVSIYGQMNYDGAETISDAEWCARFTDSANNLAIAADALERSGQPTNEVNEARESARRSAEKVCT
jgi:uncharacterized protein HemY